MSAKVHSEDAGQPLTYRECEEGLIYDRKGGRGLQNDNSQQNSS